jgi:hypothetical protein
VKRWLAETHGPFFELLRHFLLRFFDSDLTPPGQGNHTLVWQAALGLPWFFLFGQQLHYKYKVLGGARALYLQALRADELWLVTLIMSAVGLLVTLKWQSLFPGPRDYYALGSLPLRPRQIFLAKLTALLAVAAAAVIVFTALPSVMFPVVSGGRWSLQPSTAVRIGVHATASAAGAAFFFFALVALQGVLLNALTPRRFARWSGAVQGIAAATMLILIVLSFSIGPPVIAALERSTSLQWLPPAWFLGLYQKLLGDPDPLMRALAGRATAGLLIATVTAFATYLLSYRRHRGAVMENGAGQARDRRWTGALFDALVPGPRRQAIVAFMWKTLARSTHHRMVAMAYVGVAAAAVPTVFFTFDTGLPVEQFVSVHAVLLLFLLLALRHLFAIPAELRANWMFQLAEREGRDEWLDAIDCFVLALGGLAVLVLPLPVEAKRMGWRAAPEAALVFLLGVLAYERLFADWRKLPFTCSRLPGKRPLWITALYGLGLLTAFPVALRLMIVTLSSAAVAVFVVVIAIAALRRVHAARRSSWSDLRLTYDEAPDPAIEGLNLLR